MWRKRLSLVLLLIGLALILSIPIHGLWSSLSNSERIEAYEQEALNHQFSPDFFDEIGRELRGSNLKSVADPFSQSNEMSSIQGHTLPEDAVGYLGLPAINEVIPLYMGASDNHLANGSAHITGTDLPLAGMGTHTVIAGHRGYYGQTYFLYLDSLVPGDLIYLSYLGQEVVYVVTGNELITPTDGAKLSERSVGKEWLTLLTCHPFPTNRQRLLVHSRRLTEEEQTAIHIKGGKTSDPSSETAILASLPLTMYSEGSDDNQAIKVDRNWKELAKMRQYSVWIKIGSVIIGGSWFIATFWCLIRTWLK